jgi:hypothetical protein
VCLVVYQILWYLPARDLKTIRLVNRLLASIGKNNIFWTDLARLKWSEKLCLTTLPLPSPTAPSPPSSLYEMDTLEPEEPLPDTQTYLREMQNFGDHTYDELKPCTLWDLAHFFPAFILLEGSWLRAYNMIEQHFEVSYLHAMVRQDVFAVSDTQWELYSPPRAFILASSMKWDLKLTRRYSRFSRAIRSSEPHSMIHAFLDYRRDYRLHIVHGHRYWDQPFHVSTPQTIPSPL